MKRNVSKAFGKTVYLIGADIYGIKYWLEAPSFDCGWYWGFGYIRTYTNNNNPANSRDINSHSLVNSNGLSDIIKWTISDDERKEFFKLFDEFYELRKLADKAHNVNEEMYNELNRITIPAVMAKIIQIVSPV